MELLMKDQYKEQLNQTRSLINSLPWEKRDFYGNFLAQTYYFVCHSTRLLGRSLSYFGVDKDELYKRFVAHLKEENYHERIASNDLKAMDFQVEDFKQLSITKAFWETQYYKLDKSNGISLLGYILFLEAIAVHCFDHAYDVVAREYNKNAINFIRVHTTEDPEHLEHALKLINELSDEERSIVWDNFYQTADLYHSILLSISNSVDMKGNVA